MACTPTCTGRPVAFCFLTTSWASGMECVIGFSQYTALPASSASIVMRLCQCSGVAIVT